MMVRVRVRAKLECKGPPGKTMSLRIAMARMVAHWRPIVMSDVRPRRCCGASDIPRAKREVHEKASPMVPARWHRGARGSWPSEG